MMTRFVLTVGFLAALHLFCTLPDDPAKNPDNARAEFTLVNDIAPAEPIEVTEGDSVGITFRLYLGQFIDSISILIIASGDSIETSYVERSPWDDGILVDTIVFPSPGVKSCILTAFIDNGTHRRDTLIFDVKEPSINHPPVWIADTLKKESTQDSTGSFDVRQYASDPDGDSLIFSLVPPAGIDLLPFNIFGTKVDLKAPFDIGLHTVKIVVSDNRTADTAILLWKLTLSPIIPLTFIRTDLCTSPQAGKAEIAVLVNDSISSGMLSLDTVIGASFGRTEMRNDTILYHTDSGKTGIDTLMYYINKRIDSGMVIVTITVVEAATFRVTFDGNGNDHGSAPVDSAKYKPGTQISVPGNSGDLTRDGFSFAGWNSKDDGTGTDYSPGSTFSMPSSPVTLYAKWSAKPFFSVTYDGNGSSGGAAPVTLFREPKTVITIADSGSLAKPGFLFVGWNDIRDGSGKNYAPGDTLVLDTVNVTLFARWAECHYTVTYHGNGSTGGELPPITNHLYNARVTVPGAGSLEKTGHSFFGWNTDSTGNGLDYAANSLLTIGEASVDLYARWTRNQYHVTYDGNGSDNGNVPDEKKYAYEATVTIAGKGDLVRTGYTFNGWNTMANGSGTGYEVNATFVLGAKDVTLYAQWTKIICNITFDGDSATAAPNPTIKPVEYGSKVGTLPTAPQKTGYVFVGWWTDRKGAGSPLTSDSIVTKDITVYAKCVIMDADGNIYSEMRIGNQVWMVENLKTAKFNDKSAIPLVTDNAAWCALTTPAYCWFSNDITNKEPYGALYNWYAVNTGKLAPVGWHVPSNAEWTELVNFLGGSDSAGCKLREADTLRWVSRSGCPTVGFNAVPGGFRVIEGFGYMSVVGCYWTETESAESQNAVEWNIVGSSSSTYISVYNQDFYKYSGYSVRCLRNY